MLTEKEIVEILKDRKSLRDACFKRISSYEGRGILLEDFEQKLKHIELATIEINLLNKILELNQ